MSWGDGGWAALPAEEGRLRDRGGTGESSVADLRTAGPGSRILGQLPGGGEGVNAGRKLRIRWSEPLKVDTDGAMD